MLPQSKVINHRPDVSSTPIRPQSSIPQKRHSPSPSTSPKKRVKTGVPLSALNGSLSNQLVLTTRSNQQSYKHWRTPIKHKYCRSFAVRIGNLETWRVCHHTYLASGLLTRVTVLSTSRQSYQGTQDRSHLCIESRPGIPSARVDFSEHSHQLAVLSLKARCLTKEEPAEGF